MKDKLLDVFSTIFKVVIFIGVVIILYYALSSCDRQEDKFNFRDSSITICNEKVELNDFVDENEFDAKELEYYINEICVENPNKEY